jgi:hypothetical protein
MSISSYFRLAFGAAIALALSACPPAPCNPDVDDCPDDAGPPPPDYCNSMMEAQTNPMCQLTLCAVNPPPDSGVLWFINPPDGGNGDQDWYSAQLGTLNPRSLLHVTAGYAAPATPVDLSVRVLQPDGMMSITSGLDDHGQKPPAPIDLIVPYTQSDAKILILVSDKGNRTPPVFDIRNPYTISVCTLDNPDMNEPNETAAAATVIANNGGMGTATGVIATANDEDWFSFDPGSLASRQILYLHITSPTDLLPPAAYRLHYTLYDPDMVPISEGTNSSGYVKVDLATARLLKKTGAYKLDIDGFKTNPTDVIPGDLRQTYTVTLQVLPDTDPNEPNDTMGEGMGKVTTMTVGSSHTFQGSLSYVPDPEWLAIDVPVMTTPATLHAKLTWATGSGRFAPLPGPLDRQFRIMAAVKGATSADSLVACQMQSDQTTGCPKGYDPMDQTQATLVGEICQDFIDAGAAQCLWSERNEHSAFEPLTNMEAVIPIPVMNATRYWIVVGDDGNNYADDLKWTMQVWLDPDSDEATHGPTQVDTQSINSTVSGNISHGYARLTDYDPNKGPRGARGPNDYDAVPTDFDNYVFTLPGSEASWSLSWQLDHGDAGTPSAKLALDVSLCDSSNTCDDIGTLNYEDGPLGPWYSNDITARTTLYGLTMTGSYDQITLLPPACMCFESRFTTMKVKVNATDRDFYYPLNYRLIQSSGGYPPASFNVDGGSVSCPAPPLPDGGGGTGCMLE